jgi:hypothetical protein
MTTRQTFDVPPLVTDPEGEVVVVPRNFPEGLVPQRIGNKWVGVPLTTSGGGGGGSTEPALFFSGQVI